MSETMAAPQHRWSRAEYDRVYRDPAADGYRSISIHRAGDAVAPLASSDAAIAVDSLLP